MAFPLPQSIRTSLAILGATRAIVQRQEEARKMEETIARVVAIFQQSGTRWALIGAHAIGTLTQPRATADFDFVVEEPKLRGIVKALEQEFGELDAVDLGPALRLQALDVDLIRSATHPLFREALSHVRLVGDWNIPLPEVLMVLKFLAAVSPWRDRTKRMQDTVDLSTLFLAVGRDQLDADLLKKLAAQVYPGAERGFEALLDRIESGEPVTI